jgi:endonuclease G, mitochondrial
MGGVLWESKGTAWKSGGCLMNLPDDIQKELESRFSRNKKHYARTKDLVEKGEILRIDKPSRILERLTRLAVRGTLGEYSQQIEELVPETIETISDEERRRLEAQIGEWDALPGWVLTRGAEIRRTVGIVRVHDGIRPGLRGTGFLVAPNLLLTNQHVFTDLADRMTAADSFLYASNSWVEFDYEETFQGGILPTTLYRFRPDVVFLYSLARGGLDYALVAVDTKTHESSQRSGVPLSEFGFNRLDRSQGKIIVGEPVNIIHHPGGKPRNASLHSNRLLYLLEDWLHYETDTKDGSSGAPVYNRYWEVVGLHHGESLKRDAKGKPIANEGARISRVIADIDRQLKASQPDPDGRLTLEGRALVAKLLDPGSSGLLPSVPLPSNSPGLPTPDSGRRPISRPD